MRDPFLQPRAAQLGTGLERFARAAVVKPQQSAVAVLAAGILVGAAIRQMFPALAPKASAAMVEPAKAADPALPTPPAPTVCPAPASPAAPLQHLKN